MNYKPALSFVFYRYYHRRNSGYVGGGTNKEFVARRVKELTAEGWTAEEDTTHRLVLKNGRRQARYVFENVADE